jgi:hypothetical protein
MIIGHGTQGTPDARAVEEKRQHRHENRATNAAMRSNLEMPAFPWCPRPLDRLIRHAELQAAHVGAPT